MMIYKKKTQKTVSSFESFINFFKSEHYTIDLKNSPKNQGSVMIRAVLLTVYN